MPCLHKVCVVGFQYRSYGENLRANLERRLTLYGLKLHPEKTRLLEFGRFAEANRKERGLGKPESFAFLGFTHRYQTRKRDGHTDVQRRTVPKRLRNFLQEVKKALLDRRREQGTWLGQVLKVLRRRSQRHALPWSRFNRWVRHWVPSTRALHPFPDERFAF